MANELNHGVTMVIGGARSGKSRHAQLLCDRCTGEHVFIATAQAFDDEMTDRIARHRADRGGHWRTVEAPIRLPQAIAAADHPSAIILVDCLTLWASNLLLAEEAITEQLDDLHTTLSNSRARIVFVTNEVGWGIVPDNALARRFRDIAGSINQSMAARAESVHLVMAGLVTRLK